MRESPLGTPLRSKTHNLVSPFQLKLVISASSLSKINPRVTLAVQSSGKIRFSPSFQSFPPHTNPTTGGIRRKNVSIPKKMICKSPLSQYIDSLAHTSHLRGAGIFFFLKVLMNIIVSRGVQPYKTCRVRQSICEHKRWIGCGRRKSKRGAPLILASGEVWVTRTSFSLSPFICPACGNALWAKSLLGPKHVWLPVFQRRSSLNHLRGKGCNRKGPLHTPVATTLNF